MRLAVIMNQMSPWSRDIVTMLADLGAEVHVIDFESPGTETGYMAFQDTKQSGSIETFKNRMAGLHLLKSSHTSGLRYITGAREVRKICRRVDAQLLLTLYGGGSGMMAWASGFRPYAVYTVGSDVLLADGTRRLISRFVLRYASLVLSNGKYLAERTRELSPTARVEALYIGVDIARFAFEPKGRPRSTGLVSSRGFIPVYNNEAIIRALSLMGEATERISVIFVSSGPQLPEAQSLADRILPVEVRRKVEFMGGADSLALARVMRESQIYVSMSRSDGTSSSLLEAFACGVYPVLSDIPANREWFDPTVPNMSIVPLDDDEALAVALATAIEDPALRDRATAHNRKIVEERADIRRTMPRLLELLDAARTA
jgi:glycosyltransferase involved in cell wall biosynthesis